MKGIANPDGWVRLDFPGGWKGDRKNAFTGEGLTDTEKEVQQYVRTLANFRKGSSALRTGKFMHYLPQDGLYVYFRYDAGQTVMCILNTGDTEKKLNLTDYAERTHGFNRGRDVVTGTILPGSFSVPAKKITILELLK